MSKKQLTQLKLVTQRWHGDAASGGGEGGPKDYIGDNFIADYNTIITWCGFSIYGPKRNRQILLCRKMLG